VSKHFGKKKMEKRKNEKNKEYHWYWNGLRKKSAEEPVSAININLSDWEIAGISSLLDFILRINYFNYFFLLKFLNADYTRMVNPQNSLFDLTSWLINALTYINTSYVAIKASKYFSGK
jgi:hypothetical protein